MSKVEHDAPMRYVVDLNVGSPQRKEIVGAKAASISLIRELGFKVPASFCVSVAAYREILDKFKKEIDQTSASSLNALQKYFLTVSLPYSMEVEIQKELGLITETAAPSNFAVRSSATTEDSINSSFAGIHDSYLNVPRSKVLEAIRHCWASYWSERAQFYRLKRSIDASLGAMGVLVQIFINAKASGTCFSAHPVTGNHEEMVVEACFGLGEALVSGRVTPDNFLISVAAAKPTITKAQINTKRLAIVASAEGGTIAKKLEADVASQAAAPQSVILNVALAARAIAKQRQLPQDIEWCWDGENIYILQARPITTLGRAKK